MKPSTLILAVFAVLFCLSAAARPRRSPDPSVPTCDRGLVLSRTDDDAVCYTRADLRRPTSTPATCTDPADRSTCSCDDPDQVLQRRRCLSCDMEEDGVPFELVPVSRRRGRRGRTFSLCAAEDAGVEASCTAPRTLQGNSCEE